MKHFSGYGSYLLFLALRTHFHNEQYDYFQMNGKLKATKESYSKRNDRMFFEKLSKRYDAEELRSFYIANILDDRIYVTDMLDEVAHETYYKYVSWNQSLQYNLRNEIEKVFAHRKPFSVSETEYPPVLLLFLQKVIAIGTLIVLDDFIEFSNVYNQSKYLNGDILWGKIDLKIRKYRPFFRYDKTKAKQLLKETIDDQTTTGHCPRHS